VIRINLVREGRAAVRGASASGASASSISGPSNLNNILLLGMIGVGVLLAAGYWFINWREQKSLEAEVASQSAVAQQLDAIIKEVEGFTARKESLEKRIKTINELKKNQKGPVRILDRISADLPDLVWLDKMTLNGTQIAVEGRGLNTLAIANYVEAIEKDPLFDEPEVGQVTQESSGTTSVYTFEMKFNFSYTPPGEAAATTTDAAAVTTTSGTATQG
jgi:type IV pilus assembly protein PilN